MSLEVMPHSATSRERGDDMSTTVDRNSGVLLFQFTRWVNSLKHAASHDDDATTVEQKLAVS